MQCFFSEVSDVRGSLFLMPLYSCCCSSSRQLFFNLYSCCCCCCYSLQLLMFFKAVAFVVAAVLYSCCCRRCCHRTPSNCSRQTRKWFYSNLSYSWWPDFSTSPSDFSDRLASCSNSCKSLAFDTVIASAYLGIERFSEEKESKISL